MCYRKLSGKQQHRRDDISMKYHRRRMNRLPQDDDSLDEMEAEGLVSSTPTSPKSRIVTRKGIGSPCSPRSASGLTQCLLSKKRYYIFAFLILLVLILIGYTQNGNDLLGIISKHPSSENDDDGNNNSVGQGGIGGKNNLDNWELSNDDDDGNDDGEIDNDQTESDDHADSNEEIGDDDGDDDGDDATETNNNEVSADDDGDDEQSDATDYSDDYTQHVVITNENEEQKGERIKNLIDKWGKWHFWDGAAETRPTEDYLSMYPNKDCPYEGFPDESWQADAVYVNHMIDSALELVNRAREAIYTEYGFGPKDEISSDMYMTRMKMFRMSVVDFKAENALDKMNEGLKRAGWTTQKSFKGLSRRLLHSMMTNDKFTIVAGGNSAAAGFGNHFQQNYLAQFEYIMKPILQRMGVELVTRNLANKEIGTIANALGSGSIYGDNIDMIIWDSDLDTNGGDNEASLDLFFRQALMAGKRPPILVGTQDAVNVLKDLHMNADADIVVLGTGMGSMPQTIDEEQAKSLPLSVRYLNCTKSAESLCEQHKFNSRCWIERDDVTPPTKQLDHPRHQVKRHPGFRHHQLKSRVFVFLMLEILGSALNDWGDVTIQEGHPLDGVYWHLTDYYNNIQSKVKSLDESMEYCGHLKNYISERVCSIPLQARTEITPRANPSDTSIVSILEPAANGSLPKLKENLLYEGPDVPNPSLMNPSDEINVHEIIINRRRELFAWQVDFDYSFEQTIDVNSAGEHLDITEALPSVRRKITSDAMVPGEGWELSSLPGNCDGTPESVCGREASSDCLLYGQMSKEGGLVGNASSGWLVMNLPNVSEGILMLKLDPNGSLPQDFVFEYAIDGTITSLSKDEYLEKLKTPQDKVNVITLLDDLQFKTKEETKDVKFAFRVKNCDDSCQLKVTHVYWA